MDIQYYIHVIEYRKNVDFIIFTNTNTGKYEMSNE